MVQGVFVVVITIISYSHTILTPSCTIIRGKVVTLQPKFQTHNVMMQLVSSNGTVLLEREKPGTKRADNSTLHVRRMSQGIKKTVCPVLMSKEEFFTKVIKTTGNANV